MGRSLINLVTSPRQSGGETPRKGREVNRGEGLGRQGLPAR